MKSFIRNLSLVTMLLAAGIVSCSSCAHKNTDPATPDGAPSASASTTVTPVPPTPVPSTVTITHENCEFTLPSDGWKVLSDPPAHSIALINPTKKNIIVFISEPFKGTYEQYVITALRGVKDAGAVVNSAKQVEVNGTKFVLVESSKNNMTVWMWVTLIKDKGYGFSCGGPTVDSTQRDLCSGVVATLKIN